ncbi:MAG: phage antirepressor KilAC domain-containing protein [Gammaproteobacteria bacterium]|nr:phage antirepressor KilAC domain-containing protein [Gammaproteobacteria bacterium]
MNKQATYTLKEAADKLGIGPIKFNEFLRNQGVLEYEIVGLNNKYNVPTQKSINKGYALKRLSKHISPTGHVHSYALITTDGIFFLEKLIDEKYPTTEGKAA